MNGADDGDLVAPDPEIPVPGDVADAVRTLIRWAGDDPDREGLPTRPTESRARGRNIPAAMKRIPRSTSPGPSRRSAAMTRSCF
jgi:hypothetical protein